MHNIESLFILSQEEYSFSHISNIKTLIL